MSAILIALNRFGLGARPGEGSRIPDARDWLHAQLAEPPPRLAPPKGASPKEIGSAVRAFRAARPEDRSRKRKARQGLQRIAAAEASAALAARVRTERPFVERLVAFWSNHLCISTARRVLVGPLAGSYEREAIRPHVLGSFEELVLASARHPAMLLYLDNHL
ncbi:MAG: DUF1800 family protein, partial [Gemmatimonas sp.]|nr:DUF1800 family protein [Gemmatimonas sp.]